MCCACTCVLRASKITAASLSLPMRSSVICHQSSVFAPTFDAPRCLSAKHRAPANAALVRQASGPLYPVLSRPGHCWSLTPWLREDCQAPRAASAGTSSGTHISTTTARAGSSDHKSPVPTLNANGRAPLSPTIDGGNNCHHQAHRCAASFSISHWRPRVGLKFALVGFPDPARRRIFTSPTPRQDRVLPRPCLLRPTRPHPILACLPCPFCDDGLHLSSAPSPTCRPPPTPLLPDSNPSPPPPPSHLRRMRCPAPPSSAQTYAYPPQTHACPRASKYPFHNPSASHCAHASCRQAATARNFEMRSRRRRRHTTSTFPIGDKVRAARPIYRPRGGGADRRCVGSAGSYPSFSKGCGMFHGWGRMRGSKSRGRLFWKGFRRPGGGSVQGGRAAAGGASTRCSSPAWIGGRDASPQASRWEPPGIEMGDTWFRHFTPGILRVGRSGRRLSKRGPLSRLSHAHGEPRPCLGFPCRFSSMSNVSRVVPLPHRTSPMSR